MDFLPKNNLNLYNNPISDCSLLTIALMCGSHDRLWSIVRPNNLNDLTHFTGVSHNIYTLLR